MMGLSVPEQSPRARCRSRRDNLLVKFISEDGTINNALGFVVLGLGFTSVVVGLISITLLVAGLVGRVS
jgi:hypothetical protein